MSVELEPSLECLPCICIHVHVHNNIYIVHMALYSHEYTYMVNIIRVLVYLVMTGRGLSSEKYLREKHGGIVGN